MQFITINIINRKPFWGAGGLISAHRDLVNIVGNRDLYTQQLMIIFRGPGKNILMCRELGMAPFLPALNDWLEENGSIIRPG